MEFTLTKTILWSLVFTVLNCCIKSSNSQQPSSKSLHLSDLNNLLFDQYDFVIVGAGSGGCVMANRLTEIFNWTVLLIEAGDEEIHILTDVPLTAATITLTSKDDLIIRKDSISIVKFVYSRLNLFRDQTQNRNAI